MKTSDKRESIKGLMTLSVTQMKDRYVNKENGTIKIEETIWDRLAELYSDGGPLLTGRPGKFYASSSKLELVEPNAISGTRAIVGGKKDTGKKGDNTP